MTHSRIIDRLSRDELCEDLLVVGVIVSVLLVGTIMSGCQPRLLTSEKEQQVRQSQEARNVEGPVTQKESVNDPDVAKTWAHYMGVAGIVREFALTLFLAGLIWHFSYRREKPRWMKQNGCK